MDIKSINEAVTECKRFMGRVTDLKAEIDRREAQGEDNPEWHIFAGTAVSAAVKRASMDLSRALTKLRC